METPENVVGAKLFLLQFPVYWRSKFPHQGFPSLTQNQIETRQTLGVGQSPIASVQRTQTTLAGHSAVPRGTNTTPMNANRAIRIAAQRTQGL